MPISTSPNLFPPVAPPLRLFHFCNKNIGKQRRNSQHDAVFARQTVGGPGFLRDRRCRWLIIWPKNSKNSERLCTAPHGGNDVIYHPVPASRVQHSRTLRFVYHTPDGIRAFTYAEVRDLPDLA
jgi:hypothetical protein